MKHQRTKIGSHECVCGSQLLHNDRYDAYYCVSSNEWVEEACSDPKCYYCSERPDKHETDIKESSRQS